VDPVKKFDGVLYNLDAPSIPSKFRFSHPEQLYQFKEKIGSGTFYDVYRVKFLATGQEMALKKIKEDCLSDRTMNMIRLEAE